MLTWLDIAILIFSAQVALAGDAVKAVTASKGLWWRSFSNNTELNANTVPHNQPNSLSSTIGKTSSSWLGNSTIKEVCASSYFKKTARNYLASDFGEFYKSWARSAQTQPHKLNKLGEAGYFAFSQVRGWVGFECGIEHRGCVNMPTCEDILLATESKDLARKIYFTVESMDNAYYYAGEFKQAITTSRVDIAEISLLERKVIPHHQNEYVACFVLKSTIDSIIELAGRVALEVLDPPTQVIGQAYTRYLLPMKNYHRSGKHLSIHNYKVDYQYVRLSSLDTNLETIENPWYDWPPYYLGPSFRNHTCADVVPNPKGEVYVSYARFRAMILRIHDLAINEVQKRMIDVKNGLGFGMNGKMEGDDYTVLADLISTGIFLKRKPSDDETRFRLKDYYRSKLTYNLLAGSWRAHNCYITCEYDTTCVHKGPLEPMALSRFCHSPSEKCQAQCWGHRRRSKNEILPGIPAVEAEPWFVNATKLLVYARDHYEATHNRELEVSNQKIFTPSDFPMRPNYPIPVCRTPFQLVGDVTVRRHRKDFPCTCGFLGNESTQVFEAMGVPWSKSAQRRLIKKCPAKLEKMIKGPAEFFVAMCNAKLRWPDQSETKHIKKGRDHQCGPIINEVDQLLAAGRNMSEINKYFCLQSKVGNEIQGDGNHDWLGMDHVKGFTEKCQWYWTHRKPGDAWWSRESGPI
ncbi:hypothetical protein L228DRAFT_259399 [Xylona heveae TC161]|uniref:Uncharacterized protein n=1 Tax=Xylona heveae (strain CBS 132557 / TC161) TaxID=1328760 RepID=A0A165HZK0_XYLHT|nr:hypothetical protein L228DRAFT_259399 [Xylona heveae TC161]KZF24141.1 hypothetical protein L228DRAFT_259399 [Xylona heveae TC161]